MIIEQASVGFEEALRLSRLLFGNQDRLIVLAAVADSTSGSIFCRSLAESIGVTDNRVGAQLANLEEAGLLVRMPKVGGERRVYYERVESALWALATALAEEIAAKPETAGDVTGARRTSRL